jgi:hypothetical protein
MIAIGSCYLLSGILIKRGINKMNSTVLDKIRKSSYGILGINPSRLQLETYQSLIESLDKVIFRMNSVDMILVCGFAILIGHQLKPYLASIKIPVGVQSQMSPSGYNRIQYPSSNFNANNNYIQKGVFFFITNGIKNCLNENSQYLNFYY